ncbi:MAG: branched-chain amino acid ABC transporter substrate-binding protein [Treponema sp.]|nr:branched-chain amino acid ABC transporter substrate-binding protein [Treponema sp.]
MLRLSRKFLVILALVLVFSVAIVGCRRSSGPSDTGNIKIGVLVPISGSEAYFGNDMYNSFALAVDHVNARGGVLDGRMLELLAPADDGCDALMAAKAATMITSQNPHFVVGGYCSGATIPALQEFYDKDLVMLVSAANSTRITDLRLNQTFMINSPGTHQVDSLILLLNSLGVKRVATIHQGDDYTQNLSDICHAKLPGAGFEMVFTGVMEKGAPDISAIVTAIRNSRAEFVYWCGYFADGGNVIRQLRQGGYTGYICAGDGSSSVELITACGPAGEGVFVTSPPNVEFSAGGGDFLAAYRAKYNLEPGAYATLCYDTIMLLADAIEQAGTTETAAVRDKIQNANYQGLSGLISFTPNRELANSNFIIIQIRNGVYTLYNP